MNSFTLCHTPESYGEAVCGADNGNSVASTPTQLCSTGTASGVTSSGSTYSWTCAGSGSGTTATCSASMSTKCVWMPNTSPGKRLSGDTTVYPTCESSCTCGFTYKCSVGGEIAPATCGNTPTAPSDPCAVAGACVWQKGEFDGDADSDYPTCMNTNSPYCKQAVKNQSCTVSTTVECFTGQSSSVPGDCTSQTWTCGPP